MIISTHNALPEDFVVSVDGLTKKFGNFVAVDNLSFSIRRGEVFGFLGPNGAGKSTTIRMLCGLLSPTSGKAAVAGFDILRNPEDVRASIGYMSQKFSLYKDLAVGENIKFFGGVYGLEGERLRARMAAVIAMGGLAGLENALTGTLSGALQQRLALGCAIMHEPPILFLDEPTSGIDPISRRMFWDIIREMAARGITILVTTHFMDEAELCDRLGFIAAGKFTAVGTPAEIKRNAVEEDIYEVVLPLLPGVRETIGQITGVSDVSYFGRNLHVFCRRGALSADHLERELKARGLTPVSLRAINPRLEDAFIRLATLAKP